ncbi:hypothetical protein ACLBTQ_34360, partial [Pseudomonas aeruginosa]
MTSDRLAGYSRLMATLTLLLIAGMLLLNAACWIFPDLASEHGLGTFTDYRGLNVLRQGGADT